MTLALLPLHVFVVTSVVTVYASTVCLSLTRQMIYIFLHPVLRVTCLSRWNLSSVRRKEHKHFEAGYSLSYSDLIWLFSKFDGFIGLSGWSATVASILCWFTFLFVAPVCLMWVAFQAPPSTVLFSFPLFGSWPARQGRFCNVHLSLIIHNRHVLKDFLSEIEPKVSCRLADN